MLFWMHLLLRRFFQLRCEKARFVGQMGHGQGERHCATEQAQARRLGRQDDLMAGACK